MAAQSESAVYNNDTKDFSEKHPAEARQTEDTLSEEGNLVYDGDEEPEIHMRTWIALASMFVLNLVQVFALQGPPAVVSVMVPKRSITNRCSYHTLAQVWMEHLHRPGCRIHYHLSRP